MKVNKMMQSVSNMRLTLDWVGHHAENIWYCNDDVLREFSLLGFEDGTWKNEECPHFDLELPSDPPSDENGYILQVWLKTDYSEHDECVLNHSVALFKQLGDDTEDPLTHIFEDGDIWVIWSFIRSNLSYFEGLNKTPNPYRDWSEDSIGDLLFELKEWMVDNYLSSESNDPVDSHDGSISIIEKYNLLQDALEEIQTNNERKNQ